MASEMTLSSEWKTSELRHVAIALQSRRVESAHLRKGMTPESLLLTFQDCPASSRSTPRRGWCCSGRRRAAKTNVLWIST